MLEVWTLGAPGRDPKLLGRGTIGSNGLHGLVDEIAPKLHGLSPPVIALKRSRTSDPLLVLKSLRENGKEADNTARLQEILEKHHVEFWGTQLLFVQGSVACMRASRPAVLRCGIKVRTLRDILSPQVLKRVTRLELASVCAQVCAFLALMQSESSRWVHNDFKADNILLSDFEDGTQHEIKVLGKTLVAPFHIVVIDCETMSGEGFQPLQLNDCSSSTLCSFGLDEKTPYNESTDLHLFLLEIVYHIDFKAKVKPEWLTDFVVFCSLACPMSFFTTHASGGKYVTDLNRLNAEGRRILEALAADGKCKGPKDLLETEFLQSVVS